MYDTRLTVVGNLVNAVEVTRLSDGTPVANFRVASTQRRYDRAAGGWGDGDTLYVDVRCWRGLAENAHASLVKGDPVVVTGRFYTRSYEHEGQHRSTTTLEAHSVGADLARCTAAVTRTKRRGAGSADAEPGEEVVHEGPRLVAAVPVGEG